MTDWVREIDIKESDTFATPLKLDPAAPFTTQLIHVAEYCAGYYCRVGWFGHPDHMSTPVKSLDFILADDKSTQCIVPREVYICPKTPINWYHSPSLSTLPKIKIPNGNHKVWQINDRLDNDLDKESLKASDDFTSSAYQFYDRSRIPRSESSSVTTGI